MDSIPEELAPTVEQLIAALQAAADPETSLQDRQGIIDSTKELSSTLTIIGDPGTPGELQEQLTSLVQQVASTMEVGQDPELPPEERSTLILVVKRTTSALDMIRDPQTPDPLRARLTTAMEQVNYSLEETPNQQWMLTFALPASTSPDWIRDPQTPRHEQRRLAKITDEVSASMKEISDPTTSEEVRAETREDLAKQTARMKKWQEESASAQDPLDDPLSKAAALCTSAIFEAVAENDLSQSLEDLVPERWDTEGVKDFWKAEEQDDDLLDILAQLQNDEHDNAPFEVAPLITELAELVPRSKLFGTLGKAALYCQKTASYLEEDGITAGTWLAEADEG